MRRQELSAGVRSVHKEEPQPCGGSTSRTYRHVSGLVVSLASGSLAALLPMPVLESSGYELHKVKMKILLESENCYISGPWTTIKNVLELLL